MEISYLLNSHFSSSCPSLWQPPVCFLSVWVCLFGVFHLNRVIKCLSYNCLSQLTMWSNFSRVVASVSTSFLFLGPNYMPSYDCTAFGLSIHLLMTSVVSMCWLLWIIPLWTFVCLYLFEYLIEIPLGLHLGVDTKCFSLWLRSVKRIW